MSKLAAVAERLAETRRWLDQEADRLAARLDQLERRAPTTIQNMHRLVDEQLRGLDETERMVQQWLSATSELSSGGKHTPEHVGASPVAPTSPRPPESLAATLGPARSVLDEQHQYVGQLERALQTMANELPEPSADAASQSKQSGGSAPVVDSRQLLDEPQRGVHRRDEGGLESALQTLASMPRPRITPFGGKAPTAMEPAGRLPDEPQKAEDAAKQQPRKLGVARVA